jgi:uncharacterized protein
MESPLGRRLAPAVRRALDVFPVVVVVGPRQVGKTTLVRSGDVGAERVYLTLDDLDLLEEARSDPERFLGRAARVTIDEIQRSPELLLAIKRAVDRERRPGRFLITGSADIRGMKQVADHLPGRAVYAHLEPMSTAELRGEPNDASFETLLGSSSAAAARDALAGNPVRSMDLGAAIVRGGFPDPARLVDDGARQMWFDAYVRTWLERGVRDVSAITELPDLRRHMRALAARVGGLLNSADAARDSALPRTTAHRYQAALSLGLLLDLLPAFARNAGQRVIKAPRVFWRDVGLAAHLVGVHARAGIENHVAFGGLLENLVLANLRAWASGRAGVPDVFYWRTAGGREVDFVVELDDRAIPIEVKASTSVRSSDLEHLNAFLDDHRKQAPYGVVLHAGEAVQTPSSRIVAVPFGSVL